MALQTPPAQPENPGPTQTQRGCLRLPCGALGASNLNTECPLVPHPAPRSDALEMRYTASSGIEGSNPSRSGFLYRIRGIGAVCELRRTWSNAAFASQTQRRPIDR